ncbi:single-stranded DNA-binding protein [Paucibacter soli]|uniref:single-stranded DNA-binding protein n=1 Tax=Paucibacter soli TaxID=3133433 RepID=UPI0030B4C820
MSLAVSQDVNKIILLGRANGPAQIAEDSGALYADFTISTATKTVGRGGQIGERIDTHDIEASDELVEVVRALAEGDKVYVEGELCTDEIEREGQPGQFDYFTRVCARNIIVIGAAAQAIPAAVAAPVTVSVESAVVTKEVKQAPRPEPEVALESATPVPPPAEAQPNSSRPEPSPEPTKSETPAVKELKPWQRRGAAAVRAA